MRDVHVLMSTSLLLLTLLAPLRTGAPPVQAHWSASDQRPGGGEVLVTPEGTWITYTPENSGLPIASIGVIRIDYTHGHVWFAGHGSLSRLSPTGEWTTYAVPTSFANIAVDAEGNAWLGLYTGLPTDPRPAGGVVKITFDGTVTDYTPQLPYGILEIVTCRSGSVWFMERDYLTHFDGTNWVSRYLVSFRGIIEDNYADILTTIDPRYTHGMWYVEPPDGVWSFDWLIGRGVNVYDGQQWTKYTPADGLAHDIVSDMAVARDGHKWFTTWDNVSELDDRGTRRKDDDVWTTHDIYGRYAIAADGKGQVWVGTYRRSDLAGLGAVVWDGVQWRHYTTVNSGLPDDSVGDIAVDGHDVKWFATHGGVASFKERNATAEIPEPGTLLLVGLGLGALGAYLARRRVVT